MSLREIPGDGAVASTPAMAPHSPAYSSRIVSFLQFIRASAQRPESFILLVCHSRLIGSDVVRMKNINGDRGTTVVRKDDCTGSRPPPNMNRLSSLH